MRVFSKIFLDASLFLSIMGWADSQKSPVLKYLCFLTKDF